MFLNAPIWVKTAIQSLKQKKQCHKESSCIWPKLWELLEIIVLEEITFLWYFKQFLLIHHKRERITTNINNSLIQLGEVNYMITQPQTRLKTKWQNIKIHMKKGKRRISQLQGNHTQQILACKFLSLSLSLTHKIPISQK